MALPSQGLPDTTEHENVFLDLRTMRIDQAKIAVGSLNHPDRRFTLPEQSIMLDVANTISKHERHAFMPEMV